MNDSRIINDRLADGTLRPIMTGEMVAEAMANKRAAKQGPTVTLTVSPAIADYARHVFAAAKAAGSNVIVLDNGKHEPRSAE